MEKDKEIQKPLENQEVKWMTWGEVQNKRIRERQAIVKIFNEKGLGWLLKFMDDAAWSERNTENTKTQP